MSLVNAVVLAIWVEKQLRRFDQIKAVIMGQCGYVH